MRITPDIGKTLENVQSDLIFTFDILSGSRIGFASFLVLLVVENNLYFTKICFYQKRESVTM